MLLPAIRRVSGITTLFQKDSAPAHRAAYVLNCCVNKHQTFAPNLWPPNSPDLSPVMDYEIWAVMQHRVYHNQFHSEDELKRRLIDV